jgi:hypothetical protein
LLSHSVENRQDPCAKRNVGWAATIRYPEKRATSSACSSAQLPAPTQLAKYYSGISTHHYTTTAPIPPRLGSDTDCCASAIALWTEVQGGAWPLQSRVESRSKESPLPWSLAAVSHFPSEILRSLALPGAHERPVRSRGSEKAGGGRAPHSHKLSELRDHQSKNPN